MIKEVIVVEGRDDIRAVKRAFDCELIATGGFGFPKGVMERIKTAKEKRGVIIFTDPDFAGEKIRKKIASEVDGCEHAILPRDKATKDGGRGVEKASDKRDKLGRILGIGYGNSKQFLNRLNNYGVTRKEFDEALRNI